MRKEALMPDFKLKVTGLSKYFGELAAVDDASFELGENATMVISGPSGSGKTTLLRLLAGLEIPDSGEIVINGETVGSPGKQEAPHRRGMGFVFQTAALWPHLTVAGNILFGLADRQKAEKEERLQELLQRTGLEGLDKRYPDQLSGGQARRVALARALAPEPDCLLMDEPLTNVDSDLKATLLEFVKTERERIKAALIYVTHDQSEAEFLDGHKMIMDKGRLFRG